MFRRLCLFFLFTFTTLGFTACKQETTAPLDTTPPKTITAPSSLNISDGVTPIPPTYTARRLQYTMHGVRLSLDTPPGWESDIIDGLLLAEHTPAMVDGTPEVGMLVYIFAPSRRDFALTTTGRDNADNLAYSVLRNVVRTPTRIGRDATVGDPAPFEWDGFDAAYYVLSGGGARTLVLAVALPPALGTRARLVVCNISVPPEREAALRDQLPEVLDGLTIDGVRLSGEALEVLPDPLPFPRHADHDETALLPTDPSR